MVDVTERDVRPLLDLVYEAGTSTATESFPAEFIDGLARLIPSDAAGFQEAVPGPDGGVLESIERPVGRTPAAISAAAGDLVKAGLSAQDPLNFCIRRAERRALKLSSFLTPRQRGRLEWDRFVWKPLNVADSLRVWLPASSGRTRMLFLERACGEYSERDRSLLEVARPLLARIHSDAARRREEALATRLTSREREILDWIAAGRTTREIAQLLTVSPHTVRKHVENILAKLGVGTRSAAVALVSARATRASSGG
jgi:DNA-binding CsgD family transcriptional regulator